MNTDKRKHKHKRKERFSFASHCPVGGLHLLIFQIDALGVPGTKTPRPVKTPPTRRGKHREKTWKDDGRHGVPHTLIPLTADPLDHYLPVFDFRVSWAVSCVPPLLSVAVQRYLPEVSAHLSNGGFGVDTEAHSSGHLNR